MGQFEIAADVPGRVRLRIHRDAGEPALADVAGRLALAPGVRDVRTSGATRSVVVTYDAAATGVPELVDVLAAAGFAPGSGDRGTRRPPFGQALGSAGRTVAQASQHARRLEDPTLAAPVALAVLSARQVLRNGLQLDKAPWYTFAWYAYSLYGSRRGAAAP